ncbi:MAG: hypothetical protein FJY65_10285 [Calditrichaeota bacterium]|nr:hypothetical protein [Calditrichota bacterium]
MQSRLFRWVLILGVAIGLAGEGWAQPDELWRNRYGDFTGQQVFEREDGGFWMFGSTSALGVGSIDFSLIEIDAAGEFVRQRTYGGADSDYLNMVLPLVEGYLLCGSSRSFGDGSLDYWIARIDADGDSLWACNFGSDLNETLVGAVELEDGILLYGDARPVGQNSNEDQYQVKISFDGEERWSHRLDAQGRDITRNAFALPNGDVLITGNLLQPEGSQAFAERLNSEGAMLWYQTWNELFPTTLVKSILCRDGNLAMAGYCRPDGPDGDIDAYYQKINPDGEVIYVEIVGQPGTNFALDVVEAQDGGLALAGYAYGNLVEDWYAVGVDGRGRVRWVRQWDYNHSIDYCENLITTPDGGFVLAGSTTIHHPPAPMPNQALCIMHTDGSGNPLWRYVQDEMRQGLYEIGRKIQRTADGGYVLYWQEDRFYVERFGLDPVGVFESNGTAAPVSMTLKVSPNPFNSAVKIEYVINKPDWVDLAIYDIVGNQVAAIENGRREAGLHTAVWDAGDYPAGVYLGCLGCGGGQKAVKMVLVK